MADALNSGGMGWPSEIDAPANFVDSMASYIEQAYWDCLDADGKTTFERGANTESDRDRRRIFVAVARGVVGYLHDHPNAFTVSGTGLPSDTTVLINTTVPLP